MGGKGRVLLPEVMGETAQGLEDSAVHQPASSDGGVCLAPGCTTLALREHRWGNRIQSLPLWEFRPSDRGGWRGKHSEPGAIPADLSRHNRLWANRSGRESSSVWGVTGDRKT